MGVPRQNFRFLRLLGAKRGSGIVTEDREGNQGMVGPPMQGLIGFGLATRGGVRDAPLPRATLFRADGPLVSAASREDWQTTWKIFHF